MDLETGGREKETRRQRGREKHEGQYKKKNLFLQLAKADKMKKWVISWRKTSCFHLGCGIRCKLCTSLPWPCTTTCPKISALVARRPRIPTSHRLWKALWRGWAATGAASSAPLLLLFLPNLPQQLQSQRSFPPSHNNLCQQSPPGIKSHFSAQELANQQTFWRRGS